MVTIRIIIEGGCSSADNSSVADNTESLRQSFNTFFSRLLGKNDISIIMGYGYRNAAKQFLKQPSDAVLFVDSDCTPDKLDDFFLRLKKSETPIIIPDDRKLNVFFMIQEMEAWFLKQPECFDLWAKHEGYTRRTDESIFEHSLIANKDIETIEKPSTKTNDLMKHFFEKTFPGKKRILAKYGKLKTAPILLDCLDVLKLETQDSELHRFKKTILK